MRIFIKAKSGSKNQKVTKLSDSNFEISVRERPISGKANEAILKSLSDYLKVPKSKIRLISGQTSRHKVAEIML